MNKIARVILVLTILISMSVFLIPTAVSATSMRVVGYFFGSDPDSQINIVEYAKYTHMIYCEVGVTSTTDPTLQYYVGSSGGLSSVATKTHAAGGKIEICLIGGNWGEASPYPLTAIMANAGYRNTLASNLATFVTSNGLDGVDIDWEGSDVVQANYNSFLSTLRTDLGGSKVISVVGAAEWLANEWFSTAVVGSYVDFVNLSMYDIHPFPEASLLADVETYTQEWLTAGFTASQLNLGIPAFGYSAAGGIGDYYAIIANINPANNVNSTTSTTPWTTTPAEYWWSGYNLNQSKTAYAISKSLGGMMIYVANEDACGNAKSVIDAIYTSMYTAPSFSTSSTSNITSASSTLNGNISNMGSETSLVITFEYGLTTSYGQTATAVESPMATTGNFHANITGLSASSVYHFRVKAVGTTTTYTADAQFTTLAALSVSTSATSNITNTAATLNGNISSMGAETSVIVTFEYGLTTSYGLTATAAESPMTTTGNFHADVTGLSIGSVCHFRVKVVGTTTVYTADAQFTTTGTAGTNPFLFINQITGDNYVIGSGKNDNLVINNYSSGGTTTTTTTSTTTTGTVTTTGTPIIPTSTGSLLVKYLLPLAIILVTIFMVFRYWKNPILLICYFIGLMLMLILALNFMNIL